MSHSIERAPTGRAKCRGCGQTIAKTDLRMGERLPNPYSDDEGAETTHWFHLWCAAFKRPEPLIEALTSTAEVIEDRAGLEHEAQLGVTHRRAVRVDAASRAPSARAACRACKEKIEKAAWRIALVYYEDGRFSPSGYLHPACAASYLETVAILPRLRHFSTDLTEPDLADLAVALGG